MKVALFGRDGQVATEIRRRVPRDIELLVLDRDTVDFLNPDHVLETARNLNVDAAINAVAYTQVDKAEEDTERARLINATSVGALAQGCAEADCPIVHISTDYVFAGQGNTPWSPDDPVDPQSVYGATKLAGEQELTHANERHAILRTSWVFSAHRANFVKTMLKLAEDHDTLTVVSDQIGGPTSAADIADACLTLAKGLAAGKTGGIYHFSGAPDVSWADFAREIFRQSGHSVNIVDIPTSEFPRPATRPLNSRLDCSTLERDFGISRPDWRVGVGNVLQDLRN